MRRAGQIVGLQLPSLPIKGEGMRGTDSLAAASLYFPSTASPALMGSAKSRNPMRMRSPGLATVAANCPSPHVPLSFPSADPLRGSVRGSGRHSDPTIQSLGGSSVTQPAAPEAPTTPTPEVFA